jgi:hypothetical protein
LEEHLDILKASGGNYIRNTMSSRNPGNPWGFKKLDNGLYDLEQWDNEFWDVLKTCSNCVLNVTLLFKSRFGIRGIILKPKRLLVTVLKM